MGISWRCLWRLDTHGVPRHSVKCCRRNVRFILLVVNLIMTDPLLQILTLQDQSTELDD